MASGRLATLVEEPVATLVFDYPERCNAITLAMWAAIPAAIARLEDDPTVRVIVVRGAGDRAFVSGSDVSEFDAQRSGAEQMEHYRQVTDAALTALRGGGKPMVAAIRGHCIGGGISIALCCDLRLAGESARFAMPAAKIGLAYRLPDFKPIVDALGVMRAKEMFFTARRLDAAEAQQLGLLTKVVPDQDLDAEVAALCGQIAANAPLTLRAVKGICLELEKPSDTVDLNRCERLARACFESWDYAEGRRAFAEKRLPEFRGS